MARASAANRSATAECGTREAQEEGSRASKRAWRRREREIHAEGARFKEGATRFRPRTSVDA